MKTVGIAAALLGGVIASGCSGGEQTENAAVEERAASLQPGEYEQTMTVVALRSTDKSSPATQSKQGGPAVTTRTCVDEGGTFQPDAFIEAGESCTPGDIYARGGRLSLQYQCNRDGKGQLSHLIDGKFKKDSFEADVFTGTRFSGSGDYEMTRSVAGKRLGDCPAKG